VINDICDYCRREFGRDPGPTAICPHCGLGNVRDVKPLHVRETAMTVTPERAVMPQPLPKTPSTVKWNKRKKR
jgi:hypothetical protein